MCVCVSPDEDTPNPSTLRNERELHGDEGSPLPPRPKGTEGANRLIRCEKMLEDRAPEVGF